MSTNSLTTLVLLIGLCILLSKSKVAKKSYPSSDFKKQPIEQEINLEPEFMSEKIYLEKDRQVVNYNTCYTAPLEEHILKKYISYDDSRSYCSDKQYDKLLEMSYVNNPTVTCLPGFEEAEVYYNIVTKSSLLTKYGSFWCVVSKVCCK